jgi:hypothetical protein
MQNAHRDIADVEEVRVSAVFEWPNGHSAGGLDNRLEETLCPCCSNYFGDFVIEMAEFQAMSLDQLSGRKERKKSYEDVMLSGNCCVIDHICFFPR